jgi:hypothetical protein
LKSLNRFFFSNYRKSPGAFTFVVPTILLPSPSVVKFCSSQHFGERALSGEWCPDVHKHTNLST